MGGIIQYFKDTRAELRHVAWPTQTQTIVYAVLVAAISIGVTAYLGFFDFLFTNGLTRGLDLLPQGAISPITVSQVSTSSSQSPTTPAVTGPSLTIPTSTQQ